ncbi:MAG: hypothetical protein NT178_15985 [Proteobacteria bacterium]|nr:hypothetical protein [Pseudomonadota bacterium]
MQLKLEDVLKSKERELKLHQRFFDLKQFFEKTIFLSVNLPLKQHIEDLKALIEKIIPDPKDRTEEMFSGEIFTLLGTIYLHDIGLVNNFGLSSTRNILSSLEGADKRMLLSYGICEKLDIPEMAIDIINYLIFSNEIRKIPVEWEITEDGGKAIIRNAKVIAHVFNFSHLILDIFCSDLKHRKFRRFNEPHFILRHSDTKVDIDSRKGIIYIKYKAKCPYDLHLIENAKKYTDTIFSTFKRNVNGKIGLNYKDIVWDITTDFNFEREVFDMPKFSPYNEFEGPPFERWEKASLILDKMFNFGYAVAVGGTTTGKTTVMRSFIVPQMLLISPNVFYCELWEKPVSEIKNIMCKRRGQLNDPSLDIVSLCNKFLKDGPPCFFILDNCERYTYLDRTEKEKLDRFINFCFEQDNVYLIISGDKESFFEWNTLFSNANVSAICEIKPIEGAKAIDAFGENKIFRNEGERFKPIECELIQANLNIWSVLEDILEELKDEDDLRRIIAIFADKNDRHIRRYTLENVFAETAIPHKRILGYMGLLKEKDILIEYESTGQACYALSSRYLKEPLNRVLRLDAFEEKRKIRNILQNLTANEAFLDVEALKILEKWKDELVFSKEEMGLILSSIILQAKDYVPFFEKAKRDGKGIDIQPILKLLYIKDPDKRSKAISLLVEIQDKDMINPLLEHLKRENVFEIKDLMIRGMGLAGKKRTIFAIMDTLKDIGDRHLKLRAIEFFYSLLNGNVKSILSEFREIEEDPVILMKIDDLLSTIKET